MNYKRKRPKHQRAGCLLCKPHKDERIGKNNKDKTKRQDKCIADKAKGGNMNETYRDKKPFNRYTEWKKYEEWQIERHQLPARPGNHTTVAEVAYSHGWYDGIKFMAEEILEGRKHMFSGYYKKELE